MKNCFNWIVILFFFGLVIVPVGQSAEKPADGEMTMETQPNHAQVVDWDKIQILDLRTAVYVALAGNPGLQASATRVQQAKAQVEQAKSTYWPRLDINASGARVDLSENDYQQNLGLARLAQLFDPSVSAVDNPENYFKASLIASWTVFDGFERKFTNALARYGENSSKAALNDARRLLISAVSFAYYSAQLASENIAIAKADEDFNQKQLVDAKARNRVGTGALSSVLNFQVRMNQAKTNRINQEYEYQTALYGLAALLGRSDSRLPAHVGLARLSRETERELTTPPVDELLVSAMEARPDIQQLRWTIKQSEAQEEIARSDYYPSIVLAGSIDGERAEDLGFEGDDFGNTISLGLSYNIFSGGLTKARVTEARHRQMELEKRLEELSVSAASEIRKAAELVSTAQSQVALQRENSELVARTRDLVEKEYNAGQVSLVRLNEAQRDLITAQSNLALSLVALRQAWVELETRTGRILSAYSLPGWQEPEK